MLTSTPRGLLLLLCLLPLVAAPAQAREPALAGRDTGDLAATFAELTHPDGGVRSRAERRLGESLGPGHGALLAQWAAVGDSETRARLASALVHSSRHLGLALELARLPAPAADVGRQALLGHIAAWKEGLERPLLARRELDARLEQWAQDRRSKRLRLPANLEPRVALGLLGRRAELGIPLIVDPELARAAPFVPLSPEPLEGSAVDLLRAVSRTRGLALDAAQGKPERENDPPPILWLRLVRAPSQGQGSGAGQLLHWLVGLDEATPLAARASARALALCGWPAPLDLLAERWLARRDAAAESGLLAAAAVGRPHGVLLTEAAVKELVGRLDAALGGAAPDWAKGSELAQGLAGLPARGPSGADLGALLAAGFDAAPPLAQRARLAALVRMGSGTDPVRALLARVLGAEEGAYGPGILREALRARAALHEPRRGGVERPGAPRALLGSAAQGQEAALELARWLVAAELLPPEAWRDPSQLPAGLPTSAALAVLEQWLGAGELAAASAHLGKLLEDASNLAPIQAHLERWRAGGDGARLEALIAGLRGGPQAAPPALLEDLELALGLLPEERHGAALERLLARESPDPARLADLVAGPAGVRARAALVALLRDAMATATTAEAAPLAAAVVQAERRLGAAQEDGALAELRFSLSALARSGRDTALGRALLSLGRGDSLVRPVLDLGREESGLGP